MPDLEQMPAQQRIPKWSLNKLRQVGSRAVNKMVYLQFDARPAMTADRRGLAIRQEPQKHQ